MKVNYQASPDAMQNYRFCFVRSLSEVYLGKMKAFVEDELLEARCFNENGELRMFRGEDGTLSAVELIKEDTDRCIEETFVVANAKFGSTLTVRHILDADEDGQTYVKATCLCDWKGGDLA